MARHEETRRDADTRGAMADADTHERHTRETGRQRRQQATEQTRERQGDRAEAARAEGGGGERVQIQSEGDRGRGERQAPGTVGGGHEAPQNEITKRTRPLPPRGERFGDREGPRRGGGRRDRKRTAAEKGTVTDAATQRQRLSDTVTPTRTFSDKTRYNWQGTQGHSGTQGPGSVSAKRERERRRRRPHRHRRHTQETQDTRHTGTQRTKRNWQPSHFNGFYCFFKSLLGPPQTADREGGGLATEVRGRRSRGRHSDGRR